MPNNTSQHILNTSATLLGFCLIVITSVHIADQSETHAVDELTSVVGIILTFSCIFSFMSIRISDPKREKRLEIIADYLFVTALFGILTVILLIAFNFIE